MGFDLQSFSDSLDDPGSPFYSAPGLTSDETWNHARDRMAELVVELAATTADRIIVSPAHLQAFHRRIFGDLFPEDAGRFRWKYRGKWETGPFGIGVGSGPGSDVRHMRGAHPRRIEGQLKGAFQEFQQLLDDLERRSEGGERIPMLASTRAAARLYAKTLRIHPFVDGNLRAAYVTLQAALLRLGLAGVEFGDHRAHNEALAIALSPGGRRQTYEPLAELIAGLIPDL